VQTHYDILGIDPTADSDAIKHAWHVKVLLLHPDRHTGASEEVRAEAAKQTRTVNAAWGTLKDPAKRARYDLQLAQSNGASSQGGAPPPKPSTAAMVSVVCTECAESQLVLAASNRFECNKCRVAFRFCTCNSCKKIVHVRESFERWKCPACQHNQESYWTTTTTLVCIRCSTKLSFAKGSRASRCHRRFVR
jgi:curved DNA-binding protein CbpA